VLRHSEFGAHLVLLTAVNPLLFRKYTKLYHLHFSRFLSGKAIQGRRWRVKALRQTVFTRHRLPFDMAVMNLIRTIKKNVPEFTVTANRQAEFYSSTIP
jgi:hypothetical protein